MVVEENFITLKARKELFVSGLTGSSFAELRDVMGAGILSNAAWRYIISKNKHLKESIVLDFILNWLTLLLSITIFGEFPLLTLVLPFVLILILWRPSKRGSTNISSNVEQIDQKSTTLTIYRSTMLIMTSLAILAVDFPVFPRKYAKVETWGISLMDLGVGSFVFSNGIVSSKRLLQNKRYSKIEKILQSLKSSAVLLLLGIIRLLSVKASGYQEHVTEYGIHWNFFFTLSLLPISMIVFENLNTFKKLLIPALGLSIYELTMIYDPHFLDYLLDSERNNFISSNREGIFSFIGYFTIYCYGQRIGTMFFSKDTPSMKILVKLLKNLSFSTVISLFVLNWNTLGVSRRFANLPYCSLVVTCNLLLLVSYHFIFECMSERSILPTTLRKVNDNGMLLFLVSNVATGLINMSFNTLDCTTMKSMLVLTLYELGLALFALYIPFKLKI